MSRKRSERRKQREALRAGRHENDVRVVMELPEGRRFVWDLLANPLKTNTFGTTFTGNSQTFWNEGRRSIGVEVMLELQRLVPDRYSQMVAERMAELAEDNLQQQVAEDEAKGDNPGETDE